MIARRPRGGSNVASLEALEAVEVSRIAAQSRLAYRGQRPQWTSDRGLRAWRPPY